MKTTSFSSGWVCPLLLLCTICVWQCSNDDFNKDGNETVAWRMQVDYAKNYCVTKTGEWPLSLDSYQYIGTIKSEKEIPSLIDEMLSDDSHILFYNSPGDYLHPQIRTINEIRQASVPANWKGEIPDIFAGRKRVLQSIVKPGMTILRLHWLYNGDNITSTAIADDSGILYDNIGFFCMMPKVEQSGNEQRLLLHPTVQSGNNEQPSGDIILRFTKMDHDTNMFNETTWSYQITCSSTFNIQGILIDRSLHSTFNSMQGWDCHADVRTVSGTLFEDTYHEFCWAYVVGYATSTSLTWSGIGFNLSGDYSAGEQRTVIHSII